MDRRRGTQCSGEMGLCRGAEIFIIDEVGQEVKVAREVELGGFKAGRWDAREEGGGALAAGRGEKERGRLGAIFDFHSH